MINKLGDTFASCCYQSVLTHNYLAGKGKPHFPMPAIPLQVEIHPWHECSPFHSSVIISRAYTEDHDIQCIWDYNWDRCQDFGFEVGQYMNEARIQEGTRRWIMSL